MALLPHLTLLTHDAFASRACRSHHHSRLVPRFHAGCCGRSPPACLIGNKPAPVALAANIAHGPVNQTCTRVLACLLFMNSELSQKCFKGPRCTASAHKVDGRRAGKRLYSVCCSLFSWQKAFICIFMIHPRSQILGGMVFSVAAVPMWGEYMIKSFKQS